MSYGTRKFNAAFTRATSEDKDDDIKDSFYEEIERLLYKL